MLGVVSRRDARIRATLNPLVPSEGYVGVTDDTHPKADQDANSRPMCFHLPVRQPGLAAVLSPKSFLPPLTQELYLGQKYNSLTVPDSQMMLGKKKEKADF